MIFIYRKLPLGSSWNDAYTLRWFPDDQAVLLRVRAEYPDIKSLRRTLALSGTPRTRNQLYVLLRELGHLGQPLFDTKNPDTRYKYECDAWRTAFLAIKPEYHEEALAVRNAALKTYDRALPEHVRLQAHFDLEKLLTNPEDTP